jgi:cell division protein FtsW
VSRNRTLHIDAVTLSLVAAIVLLGLIMVTSASISIASKESGEVFSYLQRQLLLCVVGFVLAGLVFCIRTEHLHKMAWPLLVAAVVLLFLVLVPGVGHVVNGSRRWIRLVGFNFQASELARVLTLIFIASYAVRREEELRNTAMGLIKPVGLLVFMALLLLAEPDFGAASVLFLTGFGILFIAGARLRYVFMAAAAGVAAMALLVLLVPYRMARVTSFLDPWADPFNSGFQLTQSLIAIGRGEWFGVGLGESVQKLFYLPEAHTDFLFAVLAEELGLVGVAATLALFIALVWRSFWIAQLASRANLRFQAYLAAGFGLWLGAQALINIGVNMGVLPTKGLTLPLMSYGRSSMIVTLAWVGMLLRVYHEAMQGSRGMASARDDSHGLRAAGARA